MVQSESDEEFFDVDEDDFHDAPEGHADHHTSTSYASALASGVPAAVQYPAHCAAFEGRVTDMLQVLRSWSAQQWTCFDPQGNTVLHVAILVRNEAAIEALLELGIPSDCRNARRWTALDEAIASKHRGITKLLYAHAYASKKARMKAKKLQLLQTCNELPNYTVKVTWQLGSSVFGLLLRKYAPSDTYQVWKHNTMMRVDGTLMGMDEEVKSMIPQWRRGHFSMLLDASTQPASAFMVDHQKKLFANMAKKKKVRDIDAEVDMALQDGAGKTKIDTQDFRLKPQKTLFGYDATEKIEGWVCRIFEANGRMTAMEHLKASFVIPAGATFEEYLSLTLPEDEISEIPLSLKAMQGGLKEKERTTGLTPEEQEALEEMDDLKISPRTANASSSSSSASSTRKKGRKISAKCWMAQKFPMSLRQLLPVMDVIGHANKHLARMAKFLRKYGDMELFPVKLQIPLMMTVYLMVTFKNFVKPAANDPANFPAFYTVPSDYTEAKIKDIFGGGKHSFADSDVEEDELVTLT